MRRERLTTVSLVGLALVEGVIAYWASREPQPRTSPVELPRDEVVAGYRVEHRRDETRVTRGALVVSARPGLRARVEREGLVLEGGEVEARLRDPSQVVALDRPVTSAGDAALEVMVALPDGTHLVGAKQLSWGSGPSWLAASGPELRLRAAPDTPRTCKVSPAAKGVSVVTFDDEGKPRFVRTTDAEGAFAVDGPGRMTAYVGAFRVGERGAKAEGPCVVAIAPLGVARLRVRDAETGRPLPARIGLHARPGTKEPNLGSPERASGAGPLVDSESGVVDLAMPAGSYRAIAMHGVEFTHAEAALEVAQGRESTLDLDLVRVARTPGWASADLHVHSRGSFDALVSIEDRVRSLVAAGVDFAAASEHNRIGSYATALVATPFLTWVESVEVTTTNPLRGHFNVIPFSDDPVPRHQATTLAALSKEVRARAPDAVLQVNHPRLTAGIGHFNVIHLDTESMKGLRSLARGFDTLEVYNGFDLPKPERVDVVLLDWLRLLEEGLVTFATGSSDSHSIQYVGAGFPRTYVKVADDHDGGEGPPLDVRGLVAALKRGEAYTTAGPVLEIDGMGAKGAPAGGKLALPVRVRAAPWVGPMELTVYAGAKVVVTRDVPAATEGASPDETRARALVFDQTLDVPVRDAERAVVVVLRGKESVASRFPWMDWRAMAISNPVFLR